MIDRESRNRLAKVIERYMAEEITAFAFDDEISRIGDATRDSTVDFVVASLWYHYDDCKDHLAGLSKLEWDYFQRLILLLESDREIDRVSQHRWSVRQIAAAVALAAFGLCVVHLGVGWHLLGVAIAFGPISIALFYWPESSVLQPTKEEVNLIPFSSFSELRAVHRTVTGFSKRKYPSHGRIRNVHGPAAILLANLNLFVLLSIASPLVLLFQTLPKRETRVFIREPR